MKINSFKDINGDLVSLIKLDIKYLNDMWEYSKDPKLYEHFEFGPQQKIADTKKYLNNLIKKSNEENFLILNPDTLWNINYVPFIIKMEEIFFSEKSFMKSINASTASSLTPL